MKHQIRKLLFPPAIILIMVQLSWAHSIAPTQALSISSLTVNATHFQLGDTVNLVVVFQANISGLAKIHLHFPGFVAPPDQRPGEIERDSNIVVDSGATYNYTIPMKLYHYGGSLIETFLLPAVNIPGMMNSSSKFLDIEHSATSFQVYNAFSNTITNSSLTIQNNSFPSPPLGPTLSVSGKVVYSDPHQIDFLTNLPKKMGAYGVTVILVFHEKDQINGGRAGAFTNFYHPYTGCIQNVHYCKTDVDGNFTFNFAGPPKPGNWSEYFDVSLLVTNSNDATVIKSGNFIDIPVTNNYGCSWRTFDESESKSLPVTSGSLIQYNNVEINLDSWTGGVLRNMEFAQEFDRVRPVGIVPTQISTFAVAFNGSEAGHFYPTANAIRINIADGWADAATVDHEWGHWLHYNLMSSYGGLSQAILEGFAEFYQFAVRNYVSYTYGDIMDWHDDNPDETGTYRLKGIRYYPTSIAACGFASFLWNCYDGYSDLGFKANTFGDPTSDNDDVSEPLKIFSLFNGITSVPSTDDFKTSLENAVDTSEAVSIEKIYQYMMGNGSTLMRPAQIEDPSGHWKWSTEHTDLITVTLQWDDYRAERYFLDENPRVGTNICQSDGNGGWIFIKSVSISDEFISPEQTFTTNYSTPLLFRLTGFNSSGDSYNGPTIEPIEEGAHKISANDSKAVIPVTPIIKGLSANPNPFKDHFEVNFNLVSGSIIYYEVLNSLGDVVKSDKMNYDSPGEKHLQINSASFPSGSYIIRLFSTDAFGQQNNQSIKVSKIQ